MPASVRSISAMLMAFAVVLAGCETQTVKESPYTAMPSPPNVIKPVAVAKASKPKTDHDPADPCAMRLQAICGQLLEFYFLKHELPDKLEDLSVLNDPSSFDSQDSVPEYACPLTSQPYGYNPIGLTPPGGGENRLIVYDAAPAHDGKRWGIVMGPPVGNKPVKVFTVELSEALFRAYLPPAPASPPPSSQPTE